MEKNQKRQVAKIAVFITSIFVIFLSVTYAFINVTLAGTKRQVITAGDISLVLEEDENNLTIENALPMYDEVGMVQGDPFTFRLVNNGTTSVNYTVKLVDITTGSDKLSTSDVKYYLTKEGSGTPALLSSLTDGVIDSGTITGRKTIHYTLRLWIRDDVTDNSAISGKSLSYRIDVNANQEVETGYPVFAEDHSNAASPVLTSGMIPVVYNELQKSWVKADTTQTKYYNYETQNWANAVTVTEDNRSTYMDAPAGTVISMDDINTMWVWIPRYEYQYTNLGDQYAGGTRDLPGEIQVNFIAASQTDPSDSGVYKIPEGFTFGNENLSGLWIGKFETTGTMSAACTDENCTTADLSIKPNLTSVRSQTISSLFYASRSMQNATNANKYGFDIIGTDTMDVHMAKNTEWGLVAMLSQSKYGKYGNSAYSGANKEIYQNKSGSYITGMSNGTPSQSTTNTQVTYDIPDTGYGASTTGTIYGVYDMSGGASEYVMGNYNNTISDSGFSSLPDSKYYDLYTSSTASTGYKAGDATYETSEWYLDSASFVYSSYPFFHRGGGYGDTTGVGVFYSSGYNGQAIAYYSVRLFLKP